MMLNSMYLKIDDENIPYIEKIKDNTRLKNGSMCLYSDEEKILFTGDTIFHNCYGRCDLYTSSFDDMCKSLKKVFDMFGDEKIIIYPGHNEVCSLKEAENKIKLLLKISKKITL